MKQSRFMSLVESIANVAVGYCVALLTQLIVFPWFGIAASLAEHLAIGAAFTGVSVLRSYTMRRLFEAWRVRRERFALTRHSDHEMIGPARS
ncbi:MAG TPA: hypothetical protein VNK48_03050 [Xanthobacteraceae bacterium]|nr:hypothetical protein [Xanthobacteraceae bacterium]